MKTNNILKSAFALGLGVFLSVGAMAQDQQQNAPKQQLTPAQKQAKMVQAYKEKLDLSDAQTRKLQAINQRQVKEMQAIRNDQNLTRDAKKEKMKAIHASREAEITALLNAEQKQKYTAMQEKREARKQDGHKKHGKQGKRGQHTGDQKQSK
jgi:hypothetical protein